MHRRESHETSEVTQDATASAVSTGNCSGGYCQDFYTKVWCTNYGDAQAWDYKTCAWSGWNNPQGIPTYADSAGTVYCDNGHWIWGQVHLHCKG